jgi:hypothetical protein
MTTELEARALEPVPTLFVGTTPDQLISAASEAADALHGVIMGKHLYTRIGGRDHVQIEGWQALGSLVGVFAVKDQGVTELPWPNELPSSPGEHVPAQPGAEPPRSAAQDHARWEREVREYKDWEYRSALFGARTNGCAYGFTASYRAVKDGREVGWGQGRCTRGETHWAGRDDYALASMAQTRGQSRALRQPLGFVISLAGYAPTPAEEAAATTPNGDSELPFGREVDDTLQRAVATEIQQMHPAIDGPTFVSFVNRQLGTERLPEAAARMVAAIKWAITNEDMHGREGTADQ